ncbi:MAG: hypothetical protein M3211_08445, partial [Actinomycetota bacterium]|nr:hypothetical protein [Actinomycetota bacterium]
SVAAASVAVVVVAGGALATTASLRTSGPPQPATQAPTVVPEPERPPLREALLTADQTRYFETGDFEVTDTVRGEGDAPVSACQRDRLGAQGLGALEVWRRDFAFKDGGDLRMRTAVLQLEDAASAQQAYATLRSWVEGCEPTLLEQRGFERADVRGDWYATGPGQQEFTVFTYGPVPGDEFEELAFFDGTGIAVAGTRVMLVSMRVPGQDWNWAYDERTARQTGLGLHPMFVTMKAAHANLRR